MQWLCRCDCGTEKFVYSTNIGRGSLSCGCLIADTARRHGATADKSRKRFYGVWSGMIQRCSNPNARAFKYYGGRGIFVCDRWKNYANFEADMFHGYEHGLELDRENNMAGYCKENCRWTTRKVNNNNTRRNAVLTHDGQTMNAVQWAEKLNINAGTIYARIGRSGWTDTQALTAKIKKGHRDDI
jgi:hypothetical protein